MVCAVHTNISCHIPHEHYTCCVTLPILMTTAGFSDTHRVSCPPSPHSVSHTHCLCHHPYSYTGLVIHLQESLHPIRLKDSGTHRTSSLSTIPRNPGCHRHLHTHTHTAQSSLPSITRSHQAIIMPPTDIYSVSVTHVICVTQTVATPPPNPNTHFFLCSGGSNRVASPKSPIFSSMFSVIKKFPEQGRRNVSDAFFSASPAPHPGGPAVSPSLRSRCKMPRWCKYLSPERICRR